MASLSSIISQCLILLIHIYQRFLSPMIGPCCRFQPTCSQYSIEAVQNFGVLQGSWLTIKRLLKCHPFYVSDNNSIPPRKD
ncbi:membrane protein insertion efficiency factor YidD [Candidatus Erwinia haradaeae]|uniref:Putative membrane protein insertion efficiency factor n=1 Tax=Candidatus Erwinia haradaeae TaxID=1922217 RepID=A0A451D1P5_9GAMM|nr:membrane protein insertion efficiency factor YidD [Candidatus Erwinia haradaeae]VFP79536.1 Putative membrane protein insertion efficiency factor [Candidatus Erwinia haradaeae]